MKLSLPSMLFIVADTIARRGLPEPVEVLVDADNGLEVRCRTIAEQDTWARALKFSASELALPTRTFKNADGLPAEYRTLHGTWHGMPVSLRWRADRPLAVAA